MARELRKTGISVVGDIPWGTHFCYFYETKQDLLDTLVPYFKAGLESKEFCIWIISNFQLITVEEAKQALEQAVPDLDRHLSDENIEILNGLDWYLEENVFNLEKVTSAWDVKLKRALALGYDGMRVSGDTFWLEEKYWKDFCAYEKQLNDSITDRPMTVLCTYPLAKSGASEILDVVQTHQFAIARRQGEWEVIETPEVIQAKAEIKSLNEELEQRVIERTNELEAANEELRKEITERKQIETRLRESQQQYESLVHSTDGIVWEVDAATFNFTFVSKQAERILGYPSAQWLEPGFWPEHLHPDDRDWALGFCVDATQRRVDHQFEYRMIASDGRVVWLRDHTTVNVRMDQSAHLHGVMFDITERKEAEALLHAREQEFRAIVENAPDHIIRYDREFRRVYVNPAVAKAYGLPVEALIGKPIGSVIRDAGLDVKDDELAQLRQRIQAVFDTGKSCEFEITWQSPTGRKYYSSRLFPELDLNGSVINVLGIGRDITERKQAEEALDERLRFETLVTELSAAFANLSPNEVDREIDKWLQSLVEFLGVDRATFFQLGEDWKTLYLVHSYTVPGIEPLSLPPIGLNEQFPWITDQLRQGNTIKWSRIPDDLLEQAAKEKEYAAKTGAKSVLNIPVLVGGSVICTISFTSIRIYCDWPDAMVARLRLVGEIFAAAVERKRAEAELRKSEEQFRQMAENIREVFWLATADLSKMLYISPAYEVVWGQSCESIYREPRAFFSAIHAEDRSRVSSIIERASEQGFEVEYRVVRPDGSIRCIRDRGFPIKDESGHFYRVAGIAEDITERKRAEDELTKEKEVLEKIFDNIPVMIGFVGDDGVKLVNPEWERTIGWTLKELREQKVDIFAEAYPDPSYRQEVLDFVAAATGEWVDLKIKVRDGRVIDAACAIVHLSDGTRIAIAQDITERKQADEALRESEARNRAILKALPDLIFLMTNDGFFLDYQAKNIGDLLVPAEQFLGKNVKDVLPPELADSLTPCFQEITEATEPRVLEYPLQVGEDHRYFEIRVVRCNSDKILCVARNITDHKQAEEQLKQSESQLAEAQRLAHVGSWNLDLNSKTVTWSEELYRIFGVQPSEFDHRYEAVIGTTHPDDRDWLRSVIEDAVNTHKTFSVYYRITQPAGEVRVLHARGAVATDEHGNATRLHGTAQDVTERKQAEDELRQQKEILQQIFDHIPLMISFFEADGRIKLVNREWERMLGWSLEEIREQNLDVFAECYPDPQHRQEVLKFIAEAKGEWADFKTRVRDGRLRDTSFVRILLSDRTSIGIGQDITERKRGEEARREAEQKYKDIFENAGEGIFQSTPDGRYIEANPALASMYGFASPEELIQSCQDISRQLYVDPTRREEFKQQLDEHGAVRGFELEVFRKDGSTLWISVNARAVRDVQGVIQYYEGTAQDITEPKAAEEKLKTTSEQLRALSARLQSAREEEGTRIAREIHDELGSALTSLKWDLEEMDKILSTSDGQSETAVLRKKLHAPLTLADAAISAIRRIASELRPSILDDLGLVAAIEWQAQQFQARTGIICDCDCSLETVELSEEQSTAVFRILQEALTNVLRHAQATKVEIKIDKENGNFVLSISDNGKGITESEKSEQQSLGILGMRERAHLVGGEIDIKGAEGQGTVVTVRVPILGQDRVLRMTC